ncbi:MAG: chromate efflux transporter [Chloroflexota bacterium]|nr:chromate efflux transporter [Chloroflexota bacterium]
MGNGSGEIPVETPYERGTLGEVARLALRLGLTAFGGPAAHIAMLREEAVVRRRWLTDRYFLDLVGATNLIPGPNSTEMVIHAGYLRAGRPGLVVAGALFILPAALMTLALAWAYVRYGATPAGDRLLYGIKPVIIAVVAQALWGLGRTAVTGPLAAAVGVGAAALYLLGLNELVVLFGGALVVFLARTAARGLPGRAGATALLPWFAGSLPALVAAQAAPVELGRLFWLFLKIGATLYGSGYVLLAFLRNDFVVRLGWLSDQQLLDAVAVGQFTPGPVFTTATFVGYVVAGFPGAALATLGIFVPSFLFVALLHPLVPRLRRWAWTAALLDGVNVAAIGLMAAVAWRLGRDAIVDPVTALVAVAAAVLLIRFKVNSAWLVLGGAAVGLLAWLAG